MTMRIHKVMKHLAVEREKKIFIHYWAWHAEIQKELDSKIIWLRYNLKVEFYLKDTTVLRQVYSRANKHPYCTYM